MAAARRITISTHVLPQKYATIAAIEGTLENVDHDKAAYNKYIMDSAVGKSLGGKSSSPNSVLDDELLNSIGHVAITKLQLWEGWTSMEHPKMYWEAHDGNDANSDGTWSSTNCGRGTWWGGTALASTSYFTLSQIASIMLYCYIKNVGSTAIYVSLNGTTKWQIKISPGAAFSCRAYDGNSSDNVTTNDIKIKTLSSTSYAEFILAGNIP